MGKNCTGCTFSLFKVKNKYSCNLSMYVSASMPFGLAPVDFSLSDISGKKMGSAQ